MDSYRFDDLTRLLARPLPRRRLLRRAASALAGAALVGRSPGRRLDAPARFSCMVEIGNLTSQCAWPW